ncbi:MAG TPA: ABC transporter permease [Pseudonocardiaceae bacterium]|jgi:ABC-2 type transport system permease protein|nr:ABC transporter permease [Pseudonocardiaceae bacterium]
MTTDITARRRTTALVGTGTLLRLGARRDRIMLPIWLYVLVALAVGTAFSFKGLYPTVASRIAFAVEVGGNGGLKALTGPTFDLTSIGGLTAWRVGASAAVLVGLMNVFTVVRHTRAEEQDGRLELIGAGVVGRHAPLAAAVGLAVITDLLIGAVIAIGLVAIGQPAAGSIALGAELAAVGAAFAGIAAVAAQVTESSRAANGIASAVLGAAYLFRAIGDSATTSGLSWLSWLSPIGWGQRVRPFAGERWWVLALPIGAAALTVWLAGALVARRDLGAGLLPARPGRADARGLATPLALAWRLQRGALLAWLIAFAVLGVALGGIAQDMAGLVNTSSQLHSIIAELGGVNGIVDEFLAAMLGLLGLVAAVFTVQAVLRLRTEETAQRAEPVLATRTSRVAYAASHLTIAVVGGAALLAVGGATMGLADGLRTGNLRTELPSLLASALAQVPAAWVLAGVALALFGLLPRIAVAGWAALVVCLLLGELGPTLHVPQWAMDVSPFTHVPKLPGGQFTGTPIGWLLVVSVVLAVAGLIGFRRRDIG